MSEKGKFRVEVLQRNKIVMAVEAVVVNTTVIVGVILVNEFVVDQNLKKALIMVGGSFGVGCAIWVSWGNIKRNKKIKNLTDAWRY